MRALSSAWTECLASDQVAAGSNPAAPIWRSLLSDSLYGTPIAPCISSKPERFRVETTSTPAMTDGSGSASHLFLGKCSQGW